MLARFLVVALKFVRFVLHLHQLVAVAGDLDGVVRGDVGAFVGIVGRRGGVQAVEVLFDGFVFDHQGESWGVRFADRFAVPTRALGVDFIEHFLVGFGRPFEGVGELVLIDLVIMIDEDVSLCSGIVVVGFRRKLVRVPC